MDRTGKKIILVLALAAYILAAALIAVHYKFPYPQTARLISQRLETHSPLTAGFNDPEPGRPFILLVKNLRLGLTLPGTNPGETVDLPEFSQLKLNLRPWTLVLGRFGLRFQAKAAQGEMVGQVSYHLFGENEIALEIENINLPNFSLDHPAASGRLQGRLAGQAVFAGTRQAFPTFGRGSLSLAQGRIEGLQLPQVPLTALDFDRADLKFDLNGRQINIKELNVSGPQGRISLAGQISDLTRLHLNLSGSAQLGPADRPLAGLTFLLTGTAARPRLQVTSVTGPGRRPGS